LNLSCDTMWVEVHAWLSLWIRFKSEGLFEENFTDPCTLMERLLMQFSF